MSEMTTFEWSLEKIVWFLNFVNSVFGSMSGWTARYADEEVHDSIKELEKEIEDERQLLLHIVRGDNG